MMKMSTIFAASTLALSSVALAQSPAPAPSTQPPAAKTVPAPAAPAADLPRGTDLTLTEEQAKSWIGKSVYSSDNKELGEVAAFARDSTGKVTEMHADIGGFLGIGETRVRVMPQQMKLESDRIVLNVPSDMAKNLPKLQK